MHIAYCEPEDCPRVSQLHVTLLSLLDLAEQHELFTVIHLKKKKQEMSQWCRMMCSTAKRNRFCFKVLYLGYCMYRT